MARDRVGRLVLLVVLVLGIVGLGARAAMAQPANDACANALPIFDGNTPFSTVGATTDGQAEPFCQSDGQTYNDIWFQYTASCSGLLTISTCNAASYDTDLVVYRGCGCDDMTFQDCNDDGDGCSNFRSKIITSASIGTCYMIRVGGSGNGNIGTGTLNISCVDTSTTPGACCFPDGSCTQDSIPDCENSGGIFNGFNRPCSLSPCFQPDGVDVVYSNISEIRNWGAIGGIRAYTLDTTTCNIGIADLPWGPTSPLFAMNAYRLTNGRLEQIGMSWLKNGASSSANPGCGRPCNGHSGSVLGAGCQDAYNASFNGMWTILGPRSAANGFTGSYPGPSGTGVDLRSKRLQIHESDLSAANFPGARYLVEGVFLAATDAAAHNAMNNASYRFVNVTGSTFAMGPIGDMHDTIPAIFAWRDDGLGPNLIDPTVEIVPMDVPDEGRFYLGSKATPLIGGRWRYDYAVFNLNSDRSGGSFSIPLLPGALADNAGFHDVDYHSGEPYDNSDWRISVLSDQIIWSSPLTFAQNPNTNALRWATMYNFWFEAANPPTTRPVTLGLFKPGSPDSVSAFGVVPGPCPGDCFVDGLHDGKDAQAFAACLIGSGEDCGCADIDGNGVRDMNDVSPFVDLLLAGNACP